MPAPGDKRTPELTNVGASNDDLEHPQAAYLGTVKMAQLALPAFLGSVRGTGCRPRRSKSNHKTGPFAANAAFCRLIFLQLPSSQLDMAEACGSRTHPESAKDTGHGFEDHEDHRTPFASANSIADAMNRARRAARHPDPAGANSRRPQ